MALLSLEPQKRSTLYFVIQLEFHDECQIHQKMAIELVSTVKLWVEIVYNRRVDFMDNNLFPIDALWSE